MSGLPDLPDRVRVPDVVGEVSGWRAWKVVGTKAVPRLMSVTQSAHGMGVNAIWPTGRWFQATCPKGCIEGLPVEGCSCGIYAAKSREQLVSLGYGVYGDEVMKVIGEVAFAGKVIPGTQGWRAEKGRILRLVVPYEMWEWAAPLATAYNVPADVGFLFDAGERALGRR
jgi:hypothetical protein